MRLIAILLVLSSGVVAMPAEVAFEQTIHIRAPIERVWQALVTPEEVARYSLCPLREVGEVGEPIVYGTPGEAMITGTVQERTPGQVLRHSFRFVSEAGTDEDPETVVTYTIEPGEAPEVAVLTLRHSGFAAENQTYANVTGGWPFILSNLKTLLETGRPLYAQAPAEGGYLEEMATKADAIVRLGESDAAAAARQAAQLMQEMCAFVAGLEAAGTAPEAVQAMLDPVGGRMGAAFALMASDGEAAP